MRSFFNSQNSLEISQA